MEIWPDGPHTKPIGQQIRCAVEGELLEGGPCTMVVILDPPDHVVFYPHGVPGLAVRILITDARRLGVFLVGRLG